MNNAVKKNENVPKHQEILSNGMFHFIAWLVKCSSQDSFVHPITDWIILGAYTGFQKSEWCNDHTENFKRIIDPQWGSHAAALAVISEDFSFATATSLSLHDIYLIANNDITSITLCIWKQKTMTMVNDLSTGSKLGQPGCAPLKQELTWSATPNAYAHHTVTRLMSTLTHPPACNVKSNHWRLQLSYDTLHTRLSIYCLNTQTWKRGLATQSE